MKVYENMIISSVIDNNQNYKLKANNRTGQKEGVTPKISFQAHSLVRITRWIPAIFVTVNLILNLTKNNEKQIAPSEWDKNTMVLASQGQNVKSASSWNDPYSQQLINKLNNGCNSLIQAENSLEKSGYSVLGMTKYPLGTNNKDFDIFNKNEINKNRYVLTISQDSWRGGKTYKNEALNFATNIRKIYKIPQSNVMNVIMKDSTNFVKNISLMLKKINKLKNKDNVELLILYNGHGSSESIKVGSKNIEGAMDGIILDNLKEKRVKEVFKKLKNIKKIFIFDTCHAGSWIAQSDKKGKTLKLMNHFV